MTTVIFCFGCPHSRANNMSTHGHIALAGYLALMWPILFFLGIFADFVTLITFSSVEQFFLPLYDQNLIADLVSPARSPMSAGGEPRVRAAVTASQVL
jgi:hypothetical protein